LKNIVSQFKLLFQGNLEKTRNTLHDLQENYKQVVSTLKEKEYTISKLMKSGNQLMVMEAHIFCFYSIYSDFIYFVVNRNCLDWSCEGNVHWSEECIWWY